MDKLVERKLPCNSCESSDAYHITQRKDGSFYGYCFSCDKYDHDPYASGVSRTTNNKGVVPQLSNLSIEEILEYPVRALSERGINKDTCEHFQTRVALSTQDGATNTSHYYPTYKNDKLTGFKERIISSKQFFTHGDCKEPQLFGQKHTEANGKTLYITEGECDAMALYQVLRGNSTIPDWKPSVVSLARGSAAAMSDITNNFEFVDSFKKVILVFDQDTPGEKAVEEVCKVLAGKVFVVKLPLKDANDCLIHDREKDLYWACMSRYSKYQPDGIVNGGDTWERFRHSTNKQCYPYPETWTDLNNKTYGVRPGSLVTITSGTGSGKSTFMNELKYHFYKTTDFKLADISLEEDIGDTVGNLMGIHLNKRIQLPDVKATDQELEESHSYLYSSRRWELYDHFGGMDDDSLFGKLRYFAASGCKFIFLDHLSIIISEYASEGNERERIDTIMTKLAKLVKEWDIVIFLVVHLRKTGHGTSFELGAIPTLDDLRGSGTLKQLSWDVLGLSRDQQHPDLFCANTSRVTVLKCRFTGNTGEADYLNFSKDSGRMIKVPKPPNYDLKVVGDKYDV